MAGIIEKRGCRALKINGIGNHIHFLLRVTTSCLFSDLVHDLKLGATHYLKSHHAEFPDFEGWGKEYAVFSCSASDHSRIVQYISNQEDHHKTITEEDEMQGFCRMAGLEFHAL